MSVATEAVLPAPPTVEKTRGYWRTVGRRLARDKLSMTCLGVLALIVLSAVFAPFLGLADPYQGSMIRRLRPIGTEGHLLGTDELGRDMLARLVYGGRLSLLIGLLPVFNAFVIGSALGILAGYAGGRTNAAIMRTIDVFYAFPSVLLAIAISGALGAGITNSIVSLTIVFIPPIARVAESVARGEPGHSVVSYTGIAKDAPYVIAARERGVLTRREMFRSVAPDGVIEADGSKTACDAIVWATGFRPSLSHLAGLGVVNERGGVAVDGTQVSGEPMLHLIGFGPSQSTVGANRAGRVAVVKLKRALGKK